MEPTHSIMLYFCGVVFGVETLLIMHADRIYIYPKQLSKTQLRTVVPEITSAVSMVDGVSKE